MKTLEPFVALAYCAGVTTTMRLITHMAVAPYRNPFLLAKEITPLDVVSGGRATIGLGSGYLRSEFSGDPNCAIKGLAAVSSTADPQPTRNSATRNGR